MLQWRVFTDGKTNPLRVSARLPTRALQALARGGEEPGARSSASVALLDGDVAVVRATGALSTGTPAEAQVAPGGGSGRRQQAAHAD
jgi:hypothetical protein